MNARMIKNTEEIRNILMRRDNLSYEEANDLIELTIEELKPAIAEIDLEAAEDVMAFNLGLEPDYIEDLIEW